MTAYYYRDRNHGDSLKPQPVQFGCHTVNFYQFASEQWD